jgi:hypothetical protein
MDGGAVVFVHDHDCHERFWIERGHGDLLRAK